MKFMQDVDFTVAIAVLIDRGKVLINQRPKGWLKDFWEFPGGKLEAGEMIEETLKREMLEEFNLLVEPKYELMNYDFDYGKYMCRLRFWLCEASALAIASMLPLEGQNFVWADLEAVAAGKYNFLEGNRKFIEEFVVGKYGLWG
jgi:8-oxo-dGTP diphosphatase